MTHNGGDGSDVERLEEDRCKSFDVERPGHTHRCRLEKAHSDGKHRCICNRSGEHDGQTLA